MYVLSKQDLWDSLLEYPEAKRTLIEKGRQLLRKDNLLDEEVARRQDMEHNSLEEKVEGLESTYDIMNIRIARLLAEFDAMQVELTERLATVEQELHKKRYFVPYKGWPSSTPAAFFAVLESEDETDERRYNTLLVGHPMHLTKSL